MWTMDILAGTVLQSTHDTYDLERRLKLKNSWEETTPGRGTRAGAAVTYALMKRAMLNNDLATLQVTLVPTHAHTCSCHCNTRAHTTVTCI